MQDASHFINPIRFFLFFSTTSTLTLIGVFIVSRNLSKLLMDHSKRILSLFSCIPAGNLSTTSSKLGAKTSKVN